MVLTVLYPFMEETFSDHTVCAICEIKRKVQKGQINPIILVDKAGRTSDALKKEHLDFQIFELNYTVYPTDFYFKVFFKLFLFSLPTFVFARRNKIDLIHFYDLLSALTWGGMARMYRIAYIISLNKAEKYSKYASIILSDARRLIAPSQKLKNIFPSSYQSNISILPIFSSIPVIYEKQCTKQRQKYVKEFKLPDDTVFIGLEISDKSTVLLDVCSYLSQALKAPLFIFLDQDTDSISVGNVTIYPLGQGGLKNALPLCDLFFGLDETRFDSPNTYNAMQLNVPVYVTDEGVYKELVVDGKTGVFIKNNMPSELFKKTEQQINIIKNAKEWVDLLMKNAVSSWLDLYQQVLSKKKSAGLLNKSQGE